MNTDELFAKMAEDELKDKVASAKFATPIEYARSRGMAPQKVYYRLRHGQLDWHVCDCGRKVISIAEADKLFGRGEDAGVEQQHEDADPGEDEDA